MRTTLNLADDVATQAADIARREGRSLSQVVSELARAGLRARTEGSALAQYAPDVLDTGRALVDVTDVAAVLELLDDGR